MFVTILAFLYLLSMEIKTIYIASTTFHFWCMLMPVSQAIFCDKSRDDQSSRDKTNCYLDYRVDLLYS